jgi:hypothetical protein
MRAIGGDGSSMTLRGSGRWASTAAVPGWPSAVRLLLTVLVASAVLLALGTSAAHAEFMTLAGTFGSEGTGADQFSAPQGIGVDQTVLTATSGDVYVADTGNARVEQFDSSGKFIRMWGWGVTDGASAFEICTSACHAGLPGAGAGQFTSPTSIAVDSSNGPSQGDIYVGDNGNAVVYKFSPSGVLLATITGPSESTHFKAIAGVAVDPNGDLWVADKNADIVYRFEGDGSAQSEFNDTYGTTEEIAVDAADEVYLIRGSQETERWSSAARAGTSSAVEIDPNSGTGLAVDFSTDNLFVDRGNGIDVWQASGASLGSFAEGKLTGAAQLAYNSNFSAPGSGGAGTLYAVEAGGNEVAIFEQPLPAAPAVQPESESAVNVTAKAASLNAKVTPNGEDTHVYFEYGLTTAYGNTSPLPPGGDIGTSFGAIAYATSISGLSPSTTYHYRVVATNALGTVDGPDQTLTTGTPTKPTISAESAPNITSTNVNLQASINPELADTHYYFEYGPTSAYGVQVPSPPGADLGEAAEKTVSAAVRGLVPNSTYHYRVVASNALGTVDGQDETFTTAPPIKIDSVAATAVAASTAELKAKINPEGTVAHYHFEYGTTPSYGSDAPIPDGAVGALEGDQGVAVKIEGLQPGTTYYVRVVASDTFTTETADAAPFTTYVVGEPDVLPDNRAYELVSPTEKNGADVGGKAVDEEVLAGPSAWGRAAASGSAIAYISTSSFGDAQSAPIFSQYLASRGPTGWTTQSISPPIVKRPPESQQPGYRLYTAELTAGVIQWGSAALTPEVPSEKAENIYKHQFGAVPYELVTNVAPATQTGGYEVTLAGASADLEHVVFDATGSLAGGANVNANNVYEWLDGTLQLVNVLPGPGGAPAAGATAGDAEISEDVQENVISNDGSRIFWTDNEGNLYVREDGRTTVQLNVSQRAGSLGNGHARFKGAAADGARVFFTDETPLTSNPSDNGGLYEYDLGDRQLRDVTPDSVTPEVLGLLGTSEDGQSVYFVSRASLLSGAPAGGYDLYLSREGVLKFIASLSSADERDWSPYPETRRALVTPDGGHVAFVSTSTLTAYNNADADTGSLDAEVYVFDAASERLVCVSCNPSGAAPIGAASEPEAEHTGKTPRFITDDGERVFFDSKDALLPSATNGQQNVYEYEDGAVHLISSGTGDEISTFSDASDSGNDAFFTTRAQLVPADTDQNSDLYDARVDGGFPAAAATEACSGETCRGSLSAPPAQLSIDTETSRSAPEVAPAPQVVKASGPARHKKKRRVKNHGSKAKSKSKAKTKTKAKPKRPVGALKRSKSARRRSSAGPRKRHGGGHTS